MCEHTFAFPDNAEIGRKYEMRRRNFCKRKCEYSGKYSPHKAGAAFVKEENMCGEKFLRINNTYRVNQEKEGSYEKGDLERLEG